MTTLASRPARQKLYGKTKPRVFTAPLRALEPRSVATEKHTQGYSVIDFARDVLELELFPWQEWLLVHALETLPDGSWRFRNIVVSVARQQGKSTLSQVLALWFMFVYGAPLVIGTAQDLDVAQEIWQGAVDMVEETPDLNELKDKIVKTNGKYSLDLTTGQRYKVKAANRRAGRGLSGDLILLDELREHTSWDAWGAITKTTMARPDAQIWALSNAGDASSVVLRYLRKMAHAELGDPDGINAEEKPAAALPDDEDEAEAVELEDESSLGWFEWSARPGVDVWDREGWAQANPSLGYTVNERTISSAAKTDPEWVFRTEVLCQWSDGSLEGPFPPGMWENDHANGNPRGCLDPASAIPDKAEFVFCVDVSWSRSTSHIAVAGLRADGLPHVEVVASRAGTDWVAPWLKERAGSPGLTGVTFQSSGAPVSSLGDDIKATGVPVIDWMGGDVGRACGALYDLVRGAGLRHLAQPVLDVAAGTAETRPLGDAWVWDRKKSPTDIAPLVAVTGALFALGRAEDDPGVLVW